MRRKIKKIDLNELIDADDINRTTIKGEMRKLWPAIHQKLSGCGWAARDMVRWLDERGVSMSVELFRVYLRDLDRERGYDRSTNTFHDKSNSGRSSETSRPVTNENNKANQDKQKSSLGVTTKTEDEELARPPGLTTAAWSEMQQKHKTEQRLLKKLNGE